MISQRLNVTVILILLFLATIMGAQDFRVTVAKSTIAIGDKTGLKIELRDKAGKLLPFTLKAKTNMGGFDVPEILTKGVKTNGSFECNFLAPKKAGNAKIQLTAEVSAAQAYSKDVEIVVVERSEAEFTEKLSAVVESFKGSVALKRAATDLWEPIKKETKVQEGDELLTLERSYLVLAFPDGSKTKITENTQVLLEKLRRAKDGRILVSIVIKKGGTYNVVQKMMNGSSFEVRAGSVTAGVRGTIFGVEYLENVPTVKVWDGEVVTFIGEFSSMLLGAGSTLRLTVPIEFIEEVSELVEKLQIEPLREQLPEVEKMYEEPEVRKERDEAPDSTKFLTPAPYVPPLEIRTVRRETESYIVYSIAPEFTIGPVMLGVGLTLYSTEIGGPIYYGVPHGEERSTNILDMFTLNSFGLRFEGFQLRYGYMPTVSLGLGFSVSDYVKPYAKSFDLKVFFENLEIYLHFPYEIVKLWPPTFVPSDEVYMGELALKSALFGFDIGVAGAYDDGVSKEDTVDKVTPINTSLSVFARRRLFGDLYFGSELSVQLLSDLSKFGLGIFAGLSGDLFIFDLIGGVYLSVNGFQPFHFGRAYTVQKYQDTLNSLSSTDSPVLGFLVGTSFYTSLATGRLYLCGDFQGNMNLLSEARINVPQIGAFAGMVIGMYYYDKTPFAEGELFDSDTVASLSINYPILKEALVAGLIFSWDNLNRRWTQNVFIGTEQSW